MNLYLRLIWTLLRARFMGPLSIEDTLEREFRVLPNDLDINMHMNNGRYLTMLDLMLVEYFSRVGFLKVMVQNRWRPMSGGSVITYRRGLAPFQKYKLRYAWVGSDDFWNYMRFEYVTMDGRLCAAGYMKGAVVSKGLVPTREAFDAMDLPEEMYSRTLPDPVTRWVESEAAAMKDRVQMADAA